MQQIMNFLFKNNNKSNWIAVSKLTADLRVYTRCITRNMMRRICSNLSLSKRKNDRESKKHYNKAYYLLIGLILYCDKIQVLMGLVFLLQCCCCCFFWEEQCYSLIRVFHINYKSIFIEKNMTLVSFFHNNILTIGIRNITCIQK